MTQPKFPPRVWMRASPYGERFEYLSKQEHTHALAQAKAEAFEEAAIVVGTEMRKWAIDGLVHLKVLICDRLNEKAAELRRLADGELS